MGEFCLFVFSPEFVVKCLAANSSSLNFSLVGKYVRIYHLENSLENLWQDYKFSTEYFIVIDQAYKEGN